MSYHVENPRFKELPKQLIVHEDGYMDAYKREGEPIIDYVYMLDGLEGMDNLVRILREAADTIESLRDRLQATSETCEDVSTKNGIFKCSECGCTVKEDGIDWGGIRYCPDCGKWVSA